MKLSLDTNVRQSNKVVSHQFEGVVYILDPKKNTIRILNDTAGFIWNSLKKWQTMSAVIADLSTKFDVPHEKANRDILRYLSKLSGLGYISAGKKS